MSTFALLVAAGGGLSLLGEDMARQFSGLVKAGVTLPREVGFDSDLMLTRLFEQSSAALAVLAPFFLIVTGVALLSPLLLSGWIFSSKAIQPDFARLDPLKGFSRIFSPQGAVEMVKAVLKAGLIGSVAVWVIWSHKETVLSLVSEPLERGMVHLAGLVATSFLTVTAALLLVVAVDVPFQLWDHYRKLKMTKQELRQEARETEGDPHIKARIRAQQRELARKRMMAEIPHADVIVTNPTHYAVALKYEGHRMRAPVVVAKGAHLLALKIREIGRDHGVPILEAPPLARALYQHTELGQAIPEGLYTAVAEVLAYVYQLRRARDHGAAVPRAPDALLVPAHLDPANSESKND